MKRPTLPFKTATLAALACALAACGSPTIMDMKHGIITLHGSEVTLHAGGAPDATIDANGDFAVGGNNVVTTPAERSLLMQYVQDVRAVRENGLSMGKAGIGMAVKAVGAAVSASSGNAGKAADAGSDRIEQLNLGICKDTASIKAVQDQLAAQLTAFKPYASIVGAADVSDCVKDAKD